MKRGMAQTNPITRRSVVIGSLLVPLSSYWVTNSEMAMGVTEITSTSLLMGAVFLLFGLVLVNLMLERFAPRQAFTGSEMLTVYVMLTLAMSINGIGMFGFLTTALTNPFFFATAENNWGEFVRHIPTWFAPQNPTAVARFYRGNSTLYTGEHLAAWSVPVLTWSLFTFILLGTTFCLNAILRKRWSEQEQLTYPITTLPVEMSLRQRRFTDYFRNRWLWFGFAVPCVVQSWNSVQFYVPSLPYIPVKPFDVGYLFRERPWNAVGWLPVGFHPTVIGLTFFIPLDVAFSCWFFYLFRKFEEVFAVAFGVRGLGFRFPAIAEQGTGAWIGLFLIVVWLGRSHFKAVWRNVGTRRSLDDSREPLSYRAATVGFAGGTVCLWLFSMAAGIRWWVAVLFFGLYGVYMVALTRIRCEGGVVWHFGPWRNPAELLISLVGSKSISPRSLTGLAYLQWFNLDYRCAPMPHQLEGFEIADKAQLPLRRFGYVMLWASALGIVASFWCVLSLYYAKGAGTPEVNPWRINMGMIPYWWLRRWLDAPTVADLPALGSVGLGTLTVLFLSLMRLWFVWWPFHPIGYAVGFTFIMDLVWMPMFVSWALKTLTLSVGGIRTYRAAMPFFVGLLLGDYVIACLWSLAGTILDVPMYRVFPN
jgi:hypothetical protein